MGYIYKYINTNNEIEYIGKTTRPIKERIIEHQSRDLTDFKGVIYYAEIENDYDLDIIEKVLIRNYKPIKNKKKYDTQNFIFTINESLIQWKLFTPEKTTIKNEVKVYCNLKKLLAIKNMKQNQLSYITGIRPATISDMCNGHTKSLPLENIGKICTALNCNIEDLIKIA